MFRCVKHIIYLCLFIALSGCDQQKNIQMSAFDLVDQQKMMTLVNDHDWVLVDVRSSDWFNGWPSDNTGVGGHIPGARNFDLNWLLNERDELNKLTERLFQSKGMRKAPGIVIYGSDQYEAQVLADWLVAEQGFENSDIRIFPFGFSGWLKFGGDVETMPSYTRLVPPVWLDKQLQKPQPPVILDVSYGAGIRYRLTHIPQAVHVDTSWIESKPLWNVIPDNELQQTLKRLGISQDKQVVVYSEDMTAAARMVSVLDAMGVGDVRLLNGGFKAWVEQGYIVQSGWVTPEPVEIFGTAAFSDVWVDTERVKAILNDDSEHLISVRSWREFTGKNSGYSYINAKGRIPGAVWGHSGTDPYSMQDYINPDGTLREIRDIATYWQQLSPTEDTVMAFYCGTGWRASLSWFAARLLGYENARIYDGGWMEWSSDSRRPREAG
ncbi:3-mercaptopyruvate sulfurtransferase SseA [Endozoicomonas sp. NE40]|uniref:Sulfurtransferase n=1 Tax=Endozoicomonas lisbonensis TaxID=3120522 RepID=A0ABV2SQ40_9GAMM